MPESSSKRRVDPWKSLARNTQYRLLFTSNTAHFFTMSATLLLRSMLAWELTGDEMALAYVNLASATSLLVASIFSGAVIDRVERRRLVLIAQSLVLLMEATVLLLLFLGTLEFNVLLLSTVISSAMAAFSGPARTAMAVNVVGRSVYGKALTLFAGGANIARMVSPALAGLIAAGAGITAGYVMLVALWCATLLISFRFEASHPPGNAGETTLFRDIAEGFVYLWRNPSLGMCMLFGLFPILIVMPFQHMMVMFVDLLWNEGPGGMGIMMAASGVGGLLGSVFTAYAVEGKLARNLFAGGLVVGLFFLVFSHTPWFWLAVVFVVFIYSGSVVIQTLVQTGVQLMTDERFRGRTTTVYVMCYGLAPAGSLPIAYATKHLGPAPALTIASLALIAAVLIMWFLVPSFRRIDDSARSRRET